MSDIDVKIDRISGEASAYTLMRVNFHGPSIPELEQVGFTADKTYTLYVLFTSGDVVAAYYDFYELERQVPGNNQWIIEEIKRLENNE